MNVTAENITILKSGVKPFTGRDGKTVEYSFAEVLDDEGNKFRATCDRALFPTPASKVRGTGLLDFFIATDGKTNVSKIKCRLLAFKPGR